MWEPRDKQEMIETLLNSHLITSDDAMRLAESSEGDVLAEYRRLSGTTNPQVIEELNAVRQSGKVNMLDVVGVGRIAERMELEHAASFCRRLKTFSRSHRANVWMTTLNQLGSYVQEAKRNGTR